jgi:hypothetical protein
MVGRRWWIDLPKEFLTMANTAAITVHVQFRDGSAAKQVPVTVGGKRETTDNRGNAVFTDLRAHTSYTAYCRSTSENFTSGTGTVVLVIR